MKRWPVVLLLAACGAPEPFPALDDFRAWSTWGAHPMTSMINEGASHLSGPRTIFLNQRPQPGATAFPIGTIILKRPDGEPRAFAMAKREGSFNADGAVGWEWFEVELVPQLRIVWRGVDPPANDPYGGVGNSGCNNCHTGAWENDFVQSEVMRLSSLD